MGSARLDWNRAEPSSARSGAASSNIHSVRVGKLGVGSVRLVQQPEGEAFARMTDGGGEKRKNKLQELYDDEKQRLAEKGVAGTLVKPLPCALPRFIVQSCQLTQPLTS